jgi:predicted Zn-dependent protease
LATIQKLTDIDPDSFQLHVLLGEVYANNNRFEDSLKEYRAALAKRPDAPGIHYALGTALRNLVKIDEAEKEFHEALKQDPNDFGSNQYLGEFAVGRHDYGAAIPYLLVSSAARPTTARPHILLGECYFILGDQPKAKSELLAAIQDDPSDPQTHFLLSKVYHKLGDTQNYAREISEYQRISLAVKDKTVERAIAIPQ